MVVKDEEFKVLGPIPLGWLWMILGIIGLPTALYYAYGTNNPIVGAFSAGFVLVVALYFLCYFLFNILPRSVYWYKDAEGKWHATDDAFPTNAPGLIFEIHVAGWGNRLRVYYNGEARLTVDTYGWHSSGKNPATDRPSLDELLRDKSGKTHAALISSWVRDCRFWSIDNGTAVLCRSKGRTFLYRDGDELTEALASGPEKEAIAQEAWKAMQTELLKTIAALKLDKVLGDDPPRVLTRILDWLIVLYPHAANVIGEKTGIPGNEVIYKLCERIRELEAAPAGLHRGLCDLYKFLEGPGRIKQTLQRTNDGKILLGCLTILIWDHLPEERRSELGITNEEYREAFRVVNGHEVPPTDVASTGG